MSKIKGNVINPMDMVAEYGSDALRLGLIASRSPGQNQAFSVDRIIAGRNFCNKLWNIARFIENKLGDSYQPNKPEARTLADHWIVNELQIARDTIERCLETYRFAEASEAAYHVIWDSVADWYIEASKDQDNPDLLAWVLDTSLKLAHPFAPFVTETIWQTLPWHNTLLISESWPEIISFNDIAAAEFSQVQQVITEARFVATSLPGNERYTLLYQNDSLISDNKDLIKRLAKLTDVITVDQPRGLRLALTNHDAWLDVSEKTLEEHKENLEARLATTHQEIATLEGRLSNENYVTKAPAALVEESKKQLQEKQALVERLLHELEILK
jgi:valyl-tRNA synthetase